MSVASPYKPSADEIKRLRNETSAGMLDCRAALVSANGDYEIARKGLVDQGMAKVNKKADRAANEGLIDAYIHHGGKMGVLVELNCETDFVARNERFRALAHDIAMHIAGTPIVMYVSREQVPEAQIAELRTSFRSDAMDKPEHVRERIVDGKLNKWFEDHVLLEQPYVQNDDQTIAELIGSVVGVLGEKIEVRRFAKFALGEP